MLLEIIIVLLTLLVIGLFLGIALVWKRMKLRRTEAPNFAPATTCGHTLMEEVKVSGGSDTLESPLLGQSMRSQLQTSYSRFSPSVPMQAHAKQRVKTILMQYPHWNDEEVLDNYPEMRCVYPDFTQLHRAIKEARDELSRPGSPSGYQCQAAGYHIPHVAPHVHFAPHMSAPLSARPPLSPRDRISCTSHNDLGETTSHLNYSFSNAKLHPDFSLVPKGWQKGQLLGAGSFGEVWQAIRPSGTFFAVKIMGLKDDMHLHEVQKLMKEVYTMAELQHSLITQYFGCTYDKENHKLNIFMEYVEGGSLGNMVRKLKEPLSLPTAQRYISQVIEGVAFLHSRSIIHRDLKGDNILISASEGVVKLSDFGTCKRLKSFKGTMEAATQARTMVGTPLWMAPEVINGSGEGKDGYGTSADIWSVGCVMVEMVNRGLPPWPQFANNWKAILMIGQWTKPMPPRIPEGLPALCIDFLRKCFCPNPDDRYTAEQLLHHRFISEHDAMQPAEQLMLEEIQEMIQTRTPERPGCATPRGGGGGSAPSHGAGLPLHPHSPHGGGMAGQGGHYSAYPSSPQHQQQYQQHQQQQQQQQHYHHQQQPSHMPHGGGGGGGGGGGQHLHLADQAMHATAPQSCDLTNELSLEGLRAPQQQAQQQPAAAPPRPTLTSTAISTLKSGGGGAGFATVESVDVDDDDSDHANECALQQLSLHGQGKSAASGPPAAPGGAGGAAAVLQKPPSSEGGLSSSAKASGADCTESTLAPPKPDAGGDTMGSFGCPFGMTSTIDCDSPVATQEAPRPPRPTPPVIPKLTQPPFNMGAANHAPLTSYPMPLLGSTSTSPASSPRHAASLLGSPSPSHHGRLLQGGALL